MQALIDSWKKREEYFDLTAALMQRKPAAFTGLPVLPRAALAAALFQDLPFSMLVLTATEDEALAFTENLRPFLGERARHFPVLELLPFEVYAHNIELIAARVSVPYPFISANSARSVTVSLPSVTKRRYVPLRLT